MNDNKTNEPELIDETSLNGGRDQILAYFQELTHIDDIEQCQAILESTNWNLDQAVQSYYSGSLDMNQAPNEDLNGLNIIGTNSAFVGPSNPTVNNDLFNHIPQELIDSFSSIQPTNINENIVDFDDSSYQSVSIQTSTSDNSKNKFGFNEQPSRSKRLLVFNMEYFTNKFQLHVPDSESVYKIKELCEEKLGLPAKHMKLNGWRNKDRYISDQMILYDLNLPLESNLFIINTQTEERKDESKPSASSNLFHGFNDNSGRSFELFIKVINTKNKSPQIKIINNSKSFDSSNINFNTQSHLNDFYRLHFDSSIKFIEIRRKIALMTNIFASDQEWWLYLNKYDNDDLEAEIKSYTNQSAFHKLIETSKLFPIPLTTMIEDDLSLAKMKQTLDELSSDNENIKTASSTSLTLASEASTSSQSLINNQIETSCQKNSLYDSTNPSSSKLLNSKLPFTPLTTTLSTFKQTNNKPIRMVFIVTIKNQNNFGVVEGIMPSTSSNSNPFEALKDDSVEMNSLSSIKKPKMNDDDENEKKNISFEEDLDNDEDMQNVTYEEDLDDQFISEPKQKQKPLISKDCQAGDEVGCTNAFVEEFGERYGHLMPLFFIGTLEDAIKEALLCSAKDRKLLAIYLHSDKTVFCNIFCSKTLCDENIVNFLASNFIVWPWDITLKEHEDHFYETCSKFLGSVFVKSLKDLKEKFPLFLVVTRVRSNNEVAAIIDGSSTSDDMMQRLMQTYEMFESQRVKDERDEHTRDERERIKREQDAAYQSSLEADKAKRQRQTEEDERLKQAAQLELELEKQRIESREAKRRECQSKLPVEPSENTPANLVSKIRFRLPNGETIQRRFNLKDKLESIIDFIISNNYFTDEYKLLSAWPRRDLTSESLERTLEELKLYPQETLTLEQR